MKINTKLLPIIQKFCQRPTVNWTTEFKNEKQAHRFWEECHYLFPVQLSELAHNLDPKAKDFVPTMPESLRQLRPILERVFGLKLKDPEHLLREAERNKLKQQKQKSRDDSLNEVPPTEEGDTTVQTSTKKSTGGFGKGVAVKPEPKKAVKAASAKKEKVKADSKPKKDIGALMDKATKKSKAGDYDRDAKITVKAKENPRRPGTHGHKVFASYARLKTVGAVLDAGGKIADIKWDVEHNSIEIK